MKSGRESEKDRLARAIDGLAGELDRAGSGHPSPEELSAFTGNEKERLSPPVQSRVTRHLENCEACRDLARILTVLDQEEEGFGAGGETESEPENAGAAAERAARIRSVFIDADGGPSSRSPLPRPGRPSLPRSPTALLRSPAALLRRPAAIAVALAAACVLLLVGLQFTGDSSLSGGTEPFFSLVETYTHERSRGNGLGAQLPKNGYDVRCTVGSDAWIYCFRLEGRGGFVDALAGTSCDSFVKAEAGKPILIPDENSPYFMGPQGEILLLAAFSRALEPSELAAAPSHLFAEWARRPAPESASPGETVPGEAAFCDAAETRLGPACLAVAVVKYMAGR